MPPNTIRGHISFCDQIRTNDVLISTDARRVSLIEIGLAARRVADDVLDLGLSKSAQRKVGVADPERKVLDQNFLELVGAAALVLHLGTEAVDVRDRELERLVVGIFSGPGAFVQFGINRHIGSLGRNGQSHRLVVRRYDAPEISHVGYSPRSAAT